MDTNVKKVKRPDIGHRSFQPISYTEMYEWLNSLSFQGWTALVGAYTAGGNGSVIDYLKKTYPKNLAKWREKDLRHFFHSRPWGEFKTRLERKKI